MQTYTHLAIGAAIAAISYPGDPLEQTALVVASVGPDVVMVPQYIFDKIRGRQPLAKQGPFVLTLKELSHHLFLSLAVLIAAVLLEQPLAVAFGIGWVLHIVIDILTHAGTAFQAYGDPHYIWPVGSLRGWGVWEYRIKTGQLWPLKPFELLVLIVTTAITPIAWIVR